MSKHGSPDVWCLMAGRNVMGAKPKTMSYKDAAMHEDDTGLGDGTVSSKPTGVSAITFEQTGAFFDTANTHTFLSDVADSAQETAFVVCAGFAGDVIERKFVGFSEVQKVEYEVLSQNAKLTKANAKFTVSGNRDEGVILHPLAARTTDTNGTTVDQAAQSADGGVGYVQVTAFSGLTQAVIKIQDSADGNIWADLITFTTVTEAPASERATVSGSVDRYVRAVVDVTGTGSITVFVGFKRN